MSAWKKFTREYHDGGLVGFEVGPRREVSLAIRLDPVWNEGNDAECTVRISSIDNFSEVEPFFRKIERRPHPDAFLDQVLRLGWTQEGDVELELASEGFVIFARPKVTEC